MNHEEKRPKHYLISSERRQSLIFVTDAELLDYEADVTKLRNRHRAIIRAKYRVWAGNQNKFVATEAELNKWDSRDYL